MGLPMFREPEEVIAEEAAAKLDKAAAARRSSIRREPTVRPARYSSPTITDRIRHGRREQSLLRTHALVHEEEREANQQITELEAELARLRSIRRRYRTRLDRDMTPRTRSHTERLLNELDGPQQPIPSNQENTEHVIERSSASHESVNPHLPRPPRESGLRFEFAATSHSRPTSPRGYRALNRSVIPSPPYSSSIDQREQSSLDGPMLLESNRSPALTPGFAPAHAIHRRDASGFEANDQNEDENSLVEHLVSNLQTPPPEIDTPVSDTWELSYPELRGVNHSSPRPLGMSSRRIDGLGDRRRSPSPLSDTHEEETWANLLTTMGTEGSSTVTSFASTRSEAAMQSSRSSQNTSTSFGEIGQGEESCDLDLPSGITEDDVREIRAQHRHMARHEPDGPVMTGERGLHDHRERRARRVELSMFQNILERMQRREDIPEEWWAAVGLSPDVVRGNA